MISFLGGGGGPRGVVLRGWVRSRETHDFRVSGLGLRVSGLGFRV